MGNLRPIPWIPTERPMTATEQKIVQIMAKQPPSPTSFRDAMMPMIIMTRNRPARITTIKFKTSVV